MYTGRTWVSWITNGVHNSRVSDMHRHPGLIHVCVHVLQVVYMVRSYRHQAKSWFFISGVSGRSIRRLCLFPNDMNGRCHGHSMAGKHSDAPGIYCVHRASTRLWLRMYYWVWYSCITCFIKMDIRPIGSPCRIYNIEARCPT